MKKLSIAIVGGILFTLGFLVATGIDLSPVQAFYALVLIGASCVCFAYSDTDAEKKQNLSTLKKWRTQHEKN